MTDLKKTPLNALHIELGAKMVDFGGWHMPVQYKDGILAEHKAVREDVGLFDVSHMGEVDFKGPKALAAIQKLITNDAAKLVDGKACYTCVCYPDGGIVDDCIVYRMGEEHYRIVVNASNIEKDVAHFNEHAGDLCEITNLSDEFGLLAVQGPNAVKLVSDLGGAHLADTPTFGFANGEIDGVAIMAARTGYTGEDGFELFVPATETEAVARKLIDAGAKPIGLGARDTLRLEAKLSLYGNDIDQTTTPLEATLGWTVKLDKRERGDDFVGGEALAKQKAEGFDTKLVGFKVTTRGIARQGWEVIDEQDEVIGRVTSGSTGPTVGYPVGIAYVPKAIATPGTTLRLRKGKKVIEAEIVKGPFYRRAK
jgi:aminomethyltransferase